ncbi:hypothetical protein SEA_BENCZKOWSKI14_20 [Gordonia phage Benczkowski14]|uniref:Phage virion morphogenesis protein n=2 Tax=Demosthenesvirus katyusha TaxID=1982108 RepID=A0A142KC97_9CAUD|nr:tail completion or Neck1 protein [Gordonia phage Katyusha]AMS03413.1 hypothetical protein SEA_KATYUSHA_20 [Gordonia phage Katyusha]AMS03730.1 hypothetical protein SEA_BENCZKOWSKI14_20 [Gordonia phage Benczkowski14]
MAEVSYTVETKRVQLRIRAIEQRINASGMAAFFMSVGTNYLQGRASERFAAQGDDASGKWQPLSPHTVRDKVQAGLDPRINIRTGAMKSYIEDAPGYIIGGGARGTSFGWPRASPSKDIQDRIRLAQFGSASLGLDRGDARDVPARPVIAADASDMMTLAKLLDSYIGSV